MTAVYESDWQGRKALRLSGEGACLLAIPDLALAEGRVEVDLGAEGTAYPGIAFRIRDTMNYELAYAQPHTSGEWDAIQYDPVFHGSNTWQLFHGPGAQQVAEVPPMKWHRLVVEFQKHRAMIQVEGQEPLLVDPLAHGQQRGSIGLWTYKPAYFSKLRVFDRPVSLPAASFPAPEKNLPTGILTEWFLEGFGKVACEPNGILNLNRFLPVTVKDVRLIRKFEMSESGELRFDIGFSDALTLQIDDQVIFSGRNIFHTSTDWSDRGYVSPEDHISHKLSEGVHTLTASLQAAEFFGFGLTLNIEGRRFRLLPAHLTG